MYFKTNCGLIFKNYLVEWHKEKGQGLEGAGILYPRKASHPTFENMVTFIKIVTYIEGRILFKQQEDDEQGHDSDEQGQLRDDTQQHPDDGKQIQNIDHEGHSPKHVLFDSPGQGAVTSSPKARMLNIEEENPRDVEGG